MVCAPTNTTAGVNGWLGRGWLLLMSWRSGQWRDHSENRATVDDDWMGETWEKDCKRNVKFMTTTTWLFLVHLLLTFWKFKVFTWQKLYENQFLVAWTCNLNSFCPSIIIVDNGRCRFHHTHLHYNSLQGLDSHWPPYWHGTSAYCSFSSPWQKNVMFCMFLFVCANTIMSVCNVCQCVCMGVLGVDCVIGWNILKAALNHCFQSLLPWQPED